MSDDIKSNTCPYCGAPYTIADGGCRAKCRAKCALMTKYQAMVTAWLDEQEQAGQMSNKKTEIVIRILQWGGYVTTTPPTAMPSLVSALRMARASGFAAGPCQGYPNGQRAGRIWIEDKNRPAVAVADYTPIPKRNA